MRIDVHDEDADEDDEDADEEEDEAARTAEANEGERDEVVCFSGARRVGTRR
jgi:hypothetical protein